MAFRIHDSVVRGEIDNRIKGVVRGRIWVAERTKPIVLELEGNAWPDLAGCLLTFTNPHKPAAHPHLELLHPLQKGSIGDLTASRKVRVFDVPLEDALAMLHRQEKPPEHIANSLYLEWFSEANGRVVLESADYQLTISAPEWRLTTQDERERAEQAASGMMEFMKRLTERIEQHQRGQKSPEEEWNEYDYEKFLKECDARTDKYMELLDKYGDSEDAAAKIAEEMGWEKGEERMPIEEIMEDAEYAQGEFPEEPDPKREGIDWICTEDGDIRHPLQHRCMESALKFWRGMNELGLDKTTDKALESFLFEFQTTGAKLAGALDGVAKGNNFADAAFTVALLKRALGHLSRSQAGLEAVASKQLFPETMIEEARKELFEIREGILRLMDEFRGRV